MNKPRHSPRRVAVSLLAACLTLGLLAACGGSGGNASRPSTTPATTAAGSTPAAGSPRAAGSVVATGGGKFCQELAGFVNESDIVGSLSAGPEELKRDIARYDADKSGLASDAPASIKPDVSTLLGALDQLYGALAAAGYDATKLDPSIVQKLATPDVLAAFNNLEAYAKKTCGIDLGAVASGGASTPAS